jgi:hypothetical protein
MAYLCKRPIAILSNNSFDKRGYLQKEIRLGLDKAQEMLENDIYFIPLRLEECLVPTMISNYQWIDWFKDESKTRLLNSINEGIRERLLKFAVDENSGKIHKDFYVNSLKESISDYAKLYEDLSNRINTPIYVLNIKLIDRRGSLTEILEKIQEHSSHIFYVSAEADKGATILIVLTSKNISNLQDQLLSLDGVNIIAQTLVKGV